MRKRSSIRVAVAGAVSRRIDRSDDRPFDDVAPPGSPDAQSLEAIQVVRRRCTVCEWAAEVIERGAGEDPLCPWCYGRTERAEILGIVVPDFAPGGKNSVAASLGRRGGLKGGPARAQKLSAKRRSEIASKAARARWRRKKPPQIE